MKNLVKNSATLPDLLDAAGHRWPRVRRAWFAVAILVTMLSALGGERPGNPVLPQLALRPVSLCRTQLQQKLLPS